MLGLQLNQAAGIDLHARRLQGLDAGADRRDGQPRAADVRRHGTSLPLIKAGKLKAFAVSTPKRSPLLPDVPTFTELGYPQLEALAWMGLWCPPDVPAAVQARVREAALKVLARRRCARRLLDSASTSARRAASTR